MTLKPAESRIKAEPSELYPLPKFLSEVGTPNLHNRSSTHPLTAGPSGWKFPTSSLEIGQAACLAESNHYKGPNCGLKWPIFRDTRICDWFRVTDMGHHLWEHVIEESQI